MSTTGDNNFEKNEVTIIGRNHCGEGVQSVDLSSENDRGASVVMNVKSCEKDVDSLGAPSSDFENQSTVNKECDADTSEPVRPVNKCIIVKGVCNNGCVVKKFQVSTKKRTQNKKTLLWYDRNVKVTKFICTRNSANFGIRESVGDLRMKMKGSEIDQTK